MERVSNWVKDRYNIAVRGNYDKHVNPEGYDKQVLEDGRRFIADYVADTFTTLIPLPSEGEEQPKVLDVATGTGLIAQSLTGRGFEVIGTDFSEKFLERAQSQLPEASFVRSDMNDGLPFANNSFAGLTSVWANRFMARSHLFLREAHRVLDQDGVLVWPIFPYEKVLWKIKSGIVQPGDTETLAEQVEKAGFRDVQIDRPPRKKQREHGVHRISVFEAITARK